MLPFPSGDHEPPLTSQNLFSPLKNELPSFRHPPNLRGMCCFTDEETEALGARKLPEVVAATEPSFSGPFVMSQHNGAGGWGEGNVLRALCEALNTVRRGGFVLQPGRPQEGFTLPWVHLRCQEPHCCVGQPWYILKGIGPHRNILPLDSLPLLIQIFVKCHILAGVSPDHHV